MSVIDSELFFNIFGDGIFDADWDGEYAKECERYAVVSLARHIRPKTVIEYGIQAGRMAKILLAEIPSIEKYIGIDAKTMDIIPPKQRVEKPRVVGELVSDSRLQIILRPSDDPLPMADLIYIDGGHSYECVKADTEEAEKHINKGGVIIWHDYNAEKGVNKVVDALNHTRGREQRICLIDGSTICFKFYE